MTTSTLESLLEEGQKRYENDLANLLANPELCAIFDFERQKRILWEKLMDTREAEGLTQEQMAKRLKIKTRDWVRLEETGFDHCTFDTLYEYVAALGCGLTLQVTIGNAEPEPNKIIPVIPEPSPVFINQAWWQTIKPALARSFSFLTAPLARLRSSHSWG